MIGNVISSVYLVTLFNPIVKGWEVFPSNSVAKYLAQSLIFGKMGDRGGVPSRSTFSGGGGRVGSGNIPR